MDRKLLPAGTVLLMAIGIAVAIIAYVGQVLGA